MWVHTWQHSGSTLPLYVCRGPALLPGIQWDSAVILEYSVYLTYDHYKKWAKRARER